MPKEEEGLDIMHHLLDGDKLEFFDYHIQLPHLELFGYDISITKHVVMMWIAAGLMLIIFPAIFNRKSLVPSGLRNMFEAILLFLRDDLIHPNLGKEDGNKYLPYLWTLFFFILFCNLLGLVPFAATATGNIAVTATLAIISFFAIHIAGVRKNGLIHYLQSIVPPVPLWLWPLMLVVEIVGHIARPFALTIRLFANMTAGHIVIPVFLGFIFMFPFIPIIGVSVASATALFMLEIFIAFLQAYIFVFITTVFMGIALHPEH